MTKLFVLSGEGQGRSHDLQGEILYLGRAPENDVQLKDKHVSRRHLKIRLTDGKFFIEDLQSRNGTFVKDRAIAAGKEIEVREGVPIAGGNVFFALGKPYRRDIGKFQMAVDPFSPLNDTAEMDRPKASVRNLQLMSLSPREGISPSRLS